MTVPKIREALPEDYDLISKLYHQLFGQYNNDGDLRDYISKINEDNLCYYFVACIGEIIVGTLQCKVCQSISFSGRSLMLIDNFFVDKSYRCIGIELLLLQKVNALHIIIMLILLFCFLAEGRNSLKIFIDKLDLIWF